MLVEMLDDLFRNKIHSEIVNLWHLKINNNNIKKKKKQPSPISFKHEEVDLVN